MAKSAPVMTQNVSLKTVKHSLDAAIKKLNKVKDPSAKKMVADLKIFKSSLRCGQTMVFKFPPS